MKPTDKERREVAQKLRKNAEEHPNMQLILNVAFACDCFRPIRLDGRGCGFVNARKFYLLDRAGLFDDMERKEKRC